MKKNTILYKVEGHSSIGLGHVYRSYLLISNLQKNYEFIILTKKNTKSFLFFKNKKFKVYTHNNKNILIKLNKICNENNIYKFVNDYLLINKKVINFFKSKNITSYYLDTKNITCEKKIYSINTFISNNQRHKNNFKGLKYVITDPKIRKIKKKAKSDRINLLLHFGGSDAKGLSYKILKILYKLKNINKTHVILGPATKSKLKKNIKSLIKKNKNILLYIWPKNLFKIYNKANLAIISGGNTLFNFCSESFKNISISTNDFEKINCKKMSRLNLTYYLGHFDNINKNNLTNKIIKVHHSNKKIKKYKFNGIENIKKIILNS